jgi:hypothetical protein
MSTPNFTRPSFAEALAAWTNLLKQRGWPTDLIWLFDENLCFERHPRNTNSFQVAVQTSLTPPPPEAAQIAFDYFCEFDARLVLYRLGTSRGRSVCFLLCDKWFEKKGEAEGYVRRDDWLISFRPGGPEEIEEISDRERWGGRMLRDRPLHDLDFCMTLKGVHEILAHDRVLTAYERYALKLLHVWRRLLGKGR